MMFSKIYCFRRITATAICLRAGVAIVVAIASTIACVPGYSQVARTSATYRPDVQILLMPGPGGQDMIDLTYSGVVPRAQTQRDLAAIALQTHWKTSAPEISDAALPLAGVTSYPMTSAAMTAPGAVALTDRTFQIEPLILALKSYHHLAITYIVPADFQFAGLTNYSDANVKIALNRQKSTFTYAVEIPKGDFDKLDLPLWQPQPGDVQVASQTSKSRSLALGGVLLVGVLAAAIGYGVYALLSRMQ